MNVVDADHYHFDFDGDEFQIEVPQNDLAEQEGVHLMGLSQLLVSAQDNTNKSHLVQSGTKHASHKCVYLCLYFVHVASRQTGVLGINELTSPNTFLKRAEMMQYMALMMQDPQDDAHRFFSLHAETNKDNDLADPCPTCRLLLARKRSTTTTTTEAYACCLCHKTFKKPVVGEAQTRGAETRQPVVGGAPPGRVDTPQPVEAKTNGHWLCHGCHKTSAESDHDGLWTLPPPAVRFRNHKDEPWQERWTGKPILTYLFFLV
jgi:hypothetical protein